jgi:hypothetical protein
MIKIFIWAGISVAALFNTAPFSTESDMPIQEYGDCVEKYRSNWGEDCSQCTNWNDSYVIHLRNTCTESLDVMVCVQESDKTWRRFQHSGMAPKDSLRAYACVGTGKYLSWARKAGDASITFPTMEEVNKKYKD